MEKKNNDDKPKIAVALELIIESDPNDKFPKLVIAL